MRQGNLGKNKKQSRSYPALLAGIVIKVDLKSEVKNHLAFGWERFNLPGLGAGLSDPGKTPSCFCR